MKRSVFTQLAELDQLSRASLQRRWRELFGSDPPAYGRQLLIRRLAYRIQELAYGGLSESSKARLDALGRAVASGRAAAAPDATKPVRTNAAHPPPGTRLVREFRGVRHEVVVEDRGFQFGGRKYRSLSAIAREITGTQWNGPLFFGLRSREGRGTPS